MQRSIKVGCVGVAEEIGSDYMPAESSLKGWWNGPEHGVACHRVVRNRVGKPVFGSQASDDSSENEIESFVLGRVDYFTIIFRAIGGSE